MKMNTPNDEGIAQEIKRIDEAIKRGEYKPQIMQHQHFYQVQVCDEVIVRWCANCGETHMLWRRDGSWGERWTRVWDELS